MYTSTFYSFKGGVGRTLALMNVAYYLVQRGYTVTVIDFDLEAPGIETFELFQEKPSKIKGIVDYVNEYVHSVEINNNPKVPNIKNFLYEANYKKIKKLKDKELGKLWLVPANKDISEKKFQIIDWKKLYNNQDGFLLFEELKQSISKHTKSDYLLIDSRTGLNDHSNICTKQLPDNVISMFVLNKPNIDGMKTIVDGIKGYNLEEKSISLIYVAARIPVGDDEDYIIEKQILSADKKLKITPKHDAYHSFLKIDQHPDIRLLEQFLMVSKTSENINIKKQYIQIAKQIELRNKASLDGNNMFLNGIRAMRFILPGRDEINAHSYGILTNNQISLGMDYILEDYKNRINFIENNLLHENEILLSYEGLLSEILELPIIALKEYEKFSSQNIKTKLYFIILLKINNKLAKFDKDLWFYLLKKFIDYISSNPSVSILDTDLKSIFKLSFPENNSFKKLLKNTDKYIHPFELLVKASQNILDNYDEILTKTYHKEIMIYSLIILSFSSIGETLHKVSLLKRSKFVDKIRRISKGWMFRDFDELPKKFFQYQTEADVKYESGQDFLPFETDYIIKDLRYNSSTNIKSFYSFIRDRKKPNATPDSRFNLSYRMRAIGLSNFEEGLLYVFHNNPYKSIRNFEDFLEVYVIKLRLSNQFYKNEVALKIQNSLKAIYAHLFINSIRDEQYAGIEYEEYELYSKVNEKSEVYRDDDAWLQSSAVMFDPFLAIANISEHLKRYNIPSSIEIVDPINGNPLKPEEISWLLKRLNDFCKNKNYTEFLNFVKK